MANNKVYSRAEMNGKLILYLQSVDKQADEVSFQLAKQN